MKLFLCSHFSSVGSLIKEEIENKKVAFIPTASLREGYTGYVGSARKLFKKLVAIVTEIDISTEAYSTMQSVFEDADVIYFTGGNSFFLIDQLRAEKERAETQLAQEQHKLERLENRKKYLEKGERTKRTHRLCNLGGTIESLAPEVKDLTRTEMTELMEHIFSLSEVQRAVRHMAITHIGQANREKELKADGTISSERHAD